MLEKGVTGMSMLPEYDAASALLPDDELDTAPTCGASAGGLEAAGGWDAPEVDDTPDVGFLPPVVVTTTLPPVLPGAGAPVLAGLPAFDAAGSEVPPGAVVFPAELPVMSTELAFGEPSSAFAAGTVGVAARWVAASFPARGAVGAG
jgi:hypothetical protein